MRKLYLVLLLLLFISLMLADNFFPPLGAAFCALLAYFWVAKVLKSWLISLAKKFGRAPMRYPAYRRRKIVTYASGYLLPWVLLLCKTFRKSKSNSRKSDEPKSSQNHETDFQHKLSETSDKDYSNVAFESKSHCSQSKEPLASDEFKTFVTNILEHHIKSWYLLLSQDEDFSKEMEEILEDVFAAALYRLSRLSLNQLANQLLIIIFNHLHNFNHIVRFNRRSKTRLGAKGFDSNISHPAMRDQKSEVTYIMNVCDILVDMVVPSKILHCQLSRTTITDILTKQLLVPLVNLLTDPTQIMWGIAYLLDGSEVTNYSAHSKGDIYISSSDIVNETKLYVQEQPRETAMCIKGHSSPLTKTKSLSFDCLDDLGKDNLLKLHHKDFGRSVEHIPLSKTQDIFSFKNASPIPSSSSSNHDTLGSSEEYSPDFKPLPPYSLYPVLRPKVYKTLSNCKSVPSPLFDRLPKKKSQSKLKCSFSLDALSSLAVSGLETVQQNVFQNSPSAQNLCVPTNNPTTVRKRENSPKSFVSETSDVEEAEEVTEIMNLEPFQNVRIVGFKEQSDPRNKIYILYIIKYEYLKSEENEDGDVQFIERTGSAERRFKEFIALQSKLEQPEFKKDMKGIEGPSKWLSMTISPKDKRNIEKRRLFLEKYLQTLCKRERLKDNADIHEFMGFKGDPRIAFVKNIDFPVQRILSKVMGTAFDLLKVALPTVPDGLESMGDISPIATFDKSPGTARSSILSPFNKVVKPKGKPPPLHFTFKRFSQFDEDMRVFLKDRSSDDSRSHSPDSLNATSLDHPSSSNIHSDLYSDCQPAWKRKAAELCDPPVGPRMQGDGCDSVENKSVEDHLKEFGHIQFKNLQRTFQNDIPLANTLIDIVLTILLPIHSLSDDYATIAFKVMFGDLVQTWIQRQLNYLTNCEPWALCLHSLHETLWSTENVEAKQSKDLEYCRKAALKALINKFPGILRKIIGEVQFNKNIERFLGSLLNQTHNRHLLYQIIDVIIEMLCAQELQSTQRSSD